MTRAEIAAELRRSACEDELPFSDLITEGIFAIALGWAEGEELLDNDGWRTLFLLVAEAIND